MLTQIVQQMELPNQNNSIFVAADGRNICWYQKANKEEELCAICL